MDTRYFKEEHEIFRRSVRSFIEKELQPYASEWEEQEDFPMREVFKRIGELGFFGIEYPEEYGGAGADFFYTVVFYEELVKCGSGGVSIAIATQKDLPSAYIYSDGNEEQKRYYLTKAIKGELIGALGVTEPDAGSDVAAIKTYAKKDGPDYIINGSKMFITNGCKADFVILAVKTNPKADPGYTGISLFIVDTKTKGFTVAKRLKKMGHLPSDTAELVFEDMRLPKEALLGEENMGFYIIMRNFQRERLIGAIATYSSAQNMWDITHKYILERKAFGRPIGKFQVSRHKMVDMLTEIEASKQLTLYAAWKFAKGEEATKEVSLAKLYTAEVANRVAYHCVQLFGGYGYMREYPIERAYRDIRLIPIGGGTSEIMKEIVGRLIGL